MSFIGRLNLLPLALALLAAGLAVFSGQRLLSAMYVQYSAELARSGKNGQAYAAARQAQMVAPWRLEPYRAQLHAGAGNFDGLDAAASRALVLSPADAYLWEERGRILMSANRFGDALGDVLRNVDELAPNSPRLNAINAWTAQFYWYRGNPEVRGYWLKSVRFMLRHNPRRFLMTVARRGYAEQFCWTVGMELEVSAWCERQFQKK